MIACDKCENWYHLDCIHIDDKKIDLVDQFICPVCQASEFGLSSFLPWFLHLSSDTEAATSKQHQLNGPPGKLPVRAPLAFEPSPLFRNIAPTIVGLKLLPLVSN